MHIIQAPHPTLRVVAETITTVDKKLYKFIEHFEQTLQDTTNPPGVGLAAPQVDKKLRLFSIRKYAKDDEQHQHPVLKTYINPIITQKGDTELGDPKEHWEGCLSIARLYGPVPRALWVTIEYQTIIAGQLHNSIETFEGFYARVAQHEIDHLNGILFTDYSLQFDLPVYVLNQESDEYDELEERAILETF